MIEKDLQIGVIGLGKLGMPCAEVFASVCSNVKGFDIETKNSEKIQIVTSLKQAVQDSKFIFIFVPTPHSSDYSGETPSHNLPPRDFDYTAVKNVLSQINEYIEQNQIVVLISTVLPGTVRQTLAPLLTKGTLIYNPYLVAMGTEQHDMAMPDCLIFGTETGEVHESVKQLIDLYTKFTKNDPFINIGTWEEAEAIKVFYNTFISLKISFVNMIQDVAEKLGNIDTNVVTQALINSTQRILSPRYMYAGLGDGGPCHPRDNIALRYLSQKLDLGYDFFQGIVESRDKQAKNLAKFVVKIAKEKNLPVYLHGKAFKRGLPYTHGSYSLLVNYYINHEGIQTTFIDPVTDPGNNEITDPGLFVLTHPINSEYPPYCTIPVGSVVVDPWKTAHQILAVNVIPYGDTRNRGLLKN